MNKFYMNFIFFYKIVCQICFQFTILMSETYELYMNKFSTIFINKLQNVKFVL